MKCGMEFELQNLFSYSPIHFMYQLEMQFVLSCSILQILVPYQDSTMLFSSHI